MYQGIRAQGWLVAIYYLILFMFGAIIMLNLFLAILLGNFDKARSFGQKKQVFEAFREIMADDHDLNETLDIILGDMSGHVKTKVLKWDTGQVEKIHNQGDTKLMHEVMEEGQRFYNQDDDGKKEGSPNLTA